MEEPKKLEELIQEALRERLKNCLGRSYLGQKAIETVRKAIEEKGVSLGLPIENLEVAEDGQMRMTVNVPGHWIIYVEDEDEENNDGSDI